MFRLSTQKVISAAHILRDYQGPCARLHGHNWNVKLDVISSELNDIGLTVDFLDLDKILWDVIGPFDHNNFNDFPPFNTINPTAENVAKYFYHEIKKKLPKGVEIDKIAIWETENYLVEYFEDHKK
jgi:6-pyruvoyltetrahydropterin/6-carboxytetrahydropterin synthase